MGDDDDDDGDGSSSARSSDHDSDLAEFHTAQLCSELERDVAAAHQLLGEESCLVAQLMGEDSTVTLLVSCDTLSSRVQEAWGLVAYQPIRVQLRDVSVTAYMAARKAPSCKVWQEDFDGEHYQGGVLPQLERIATEWIRAEWSKFHDERGGQYYQDVSGKEVRALSHMAQQLVDMGFNRQVAQGTHAKTKTSHRLGRVSHPLLDACAHAKTLEEALALATGESTANASKKASFSMKKPKNASSGGTGSSSSSVLNSFQSSFAEDAELKKKAFVLDSKLGFLAGLAEYMV